MKKWYHDGWFIYLILSMLCLTAGGLLLVVSQLQADLGISVAEQVKRGIFPLASLVGSIMMAAPLVLAVLISSLVRRS